MHKLNKPSFMDDDDDDDVSGFGTSSGRFLKTNKQEPKPKDNFQLELESKVKNRTKSEEEIDDIGRNSNRFMKRDSELNKRVTPARTPTPRSIATDSDIADDSGAESLRNSGNKTTGLGDSGWQPGLKKSPRSSLFDDRKRDTDRDPFSGDSSRDNKFSGKFQGDSKKEDRKAELNQKWNKPYQAPEEKKKSHFYADDDDDDDKAFGKSNMNFMKSGKPLDNKIPTDSSIRPKPRSSKLVSDLNEDDSSRQLRSTNQYDLKETDKHSMQPKSKYSNFDSFPEENEDDSFKDKPSTSSRFLKGNNVPDSKVKDKQDLSTRPIHRNSNFNYDPHEEDDESFHDKSSSSQFLKVSKFPDTNGKDKQDTSSKAKPRESRLLFNADGRDDDSFQDIPHKSPRFQTTDKAQDDRNKERPSMSRINKFQLDREDSENDSDQDRRLKSDFLKTKSHSPFDINDNENDKYFPKPQKRESKSLYQDDKETPMFRTSTFPRNEINNSSKSGQKMKDSDDIFSRGNIRSDGHDGDSDFKRRSIRFEDEAKIESGGSTRDNSPLKSHHSKSDQRQSRSPSPATSVCEELEQDPVKQKLEAIKQRRQERKRQEEVANMNSEHRTVMEAIHTVGDSQSQVDIPTSSKKKVSIPLSKKYQNVPSKITTKPNMRSVSMDHLNELLTKSYEPNTDRNYSASQAIREATYNEWYKNKLKQQKDKKKEVPVEETDTKEKRNEDDVKATYDAWLAKKKEYFLSLKKKKEDEQRKHTENKENKESKDNTFELWKKLKDESKKKEVEKQKTETKKSETQKMKDSEEKKEELRKKKIEWEKRQAHDLKMKKLKEEKEKQKKEEIRSKANEKQMLAEISYKTWEEKMEENQQKLATFSKRSESLVQNRRAWRPSSNTVAIGK